MNFTLSLILYVIIFAILLLITIRYGMSLFSAFTVSALISLLFLFLLVPPAELDQQVNLYMKEIPHRHVDDIILLIYLIIIILTVILISWYILDRAFADRDFRMKFLDCDEHMYTI